jgi:hypothetical protein
MAWSAATNTTAPCERDQHAGIGAVIGGLSFGHSTRDHDCAREHIAADLYAHGNVLAAEMVYCAISEVKAALGADCLKILRESEPVATPAPDAVTHAELQEAERRMTAHGVSK